MTDVLVYPNFVKNPKANLWLIHGYVESQECFERVFDTALAKTVNIFTVDLPGFGDALLINIGWKQYIQALAKKIKALSNDLPCVIVGHSMGGVVATQVANQLPVKQSLLIVVDGGLFEDKSRITGNVDVYPSAEQFKQSLLSGLSAKLTSQPNAQLRRLVARVNASSAEGLAYWAKAGIEMRANNQTVTLYQSIPFGKYYLIGTKSISVNDYQNSIALNKNSLIWLPDAGHWPMLDTPELFWQQIHQLIIKEIL